MNTAASCDVSKKKFKEYLYQRFGTQIQPRQHLQ
jgi:hypothetical protein